MHELSLSGAIVDTVERHADGRQVAAINLRIGRLRQVVPDSLEFYLDFVAKGTICEGARLEIEVVEAELRCQGCGDEWELAAPPFSCQACGSSDVLVVAGNEFEVESIEVTSIEIGEEACIART